MSCKYECWRLSEKVVVLLRSRSVVIFFWVESVSNKWLVFKRVVYILVGYEKEYDVYDVGFSCYLSVVKFKFDLWFEKMRNKGSY